MPYPGVIDFKNPDYLPVFQWRMERLEWLRKNPGKIPAMKAHYKANPIDLIQDWGVTFDPRNVNKLDANGDPLPTLLPLCLFPRQVEALEWMLERIKTRRRGVLDKSRDMGMSWLGAALSVALCVTNQGFVWGFGSRLANLVDNSDDPDCLFFKIRMFIAHLPKEFRAGWIEGKRQCDKYMRLRFPETGATIRGEAGDNIGRGGRTTVSFVDESAFLERPHLVENSLSNTTSCRLDISSANGTDNPFFEHRHSGKVSTFTFHWKDDPRKDDAWYAQMVNDFNPVTIAQEVDIDYSASKEGILIPALWVNAAVDAHIKLNITINGRVTGALDIADEGRDMNSFAAKRGVTMVGMEEWSGKGSHLYHTAFRAVRLADELDCESWRYDGDGMGANMRGDVEAINALPERKDFPPSMPIVFRGSSSPTQKDVFFIPAKNGRPGITNDDFFANRKAQAYWHLRTLFENTYKAVIENLVVDLDEIISIPSTLPNRVKLCSELSQPQYKINTAGKILVNKAPDGTKSPNLGDSAMMLYAPDEKVRRGFFSR